MSEMLKAIEWFIFASVDVEDSEINNKVFFFMSVWN